MSPLLFKRLSDESLGSRLASGEAAAFDELYRRYSNRLAAYGSHLLGDAAAGDDVAQATMLKAYAALREGRVPDKMKPWLFRIAHNAAIDLVARRRELPSGDLPDAPSVDREPFAGALVEALATLPDRQRRVYVLREVHGLRIDETAAELGLTAPQVEQSLFAARNRLAEQLVFGDRLNCVTVQRLAAGPLDASERRALKTHVRACNECRQSLGMRGRVLTLLPAGLEWLRGLGPGLIGGGAPAAAKVGAIVATATLAAGVPVAVQRTTRGHAHRPVLRLDRSSRSAAPQVATHPSAAVEVSAFAPPLQQTHVAAVPRAVRHGSDGAEHDGSTVGPTTAERSDGSRPGDTADGTKAGDIGSGDAGSGDAGSGEAFLSGRSGPESTTEHRDGGSSGKREGSSSAPMTADTTTRSQPRGDGGGSGSDSAGRAGTTSRSGVSGPGAETPGHGDSGDSSSGSGSGKDGSGDLTTTAAAPPSLPVVTLPDGG